MGTFSSSPDESPETSSAYAALSTPEAENATAITASAMAMHAMRLPIYDSINAPLSIPVKTFHPAQDAGAVYFHATIFFT